jgi:hypothetical protein
MASKRSQNQFALQERFSPVEAPEADNFMVSPTAAVPEKNDGELSNMELGLLSNTSAENMINMALNRSPIN